MRNNILVKLALVGVLGMFSLTSAQAASPHGGPVPSCPVGKVAKYEDGIWKCKALVFSSGNNEQRAMAGVRPVCPKGQIAKKINGTWFCKDLTIRAPGGAGRLE